MTTGVRIEAGGVLKSLDEFQKLLDGRDRAIMRYGRGLMKSDTVAGFSSGRDPEGAPWMPRKGSYPWPILRNSGNLLGSLRFSYGIKTKDRRLKFFGKVKDDDQGAIIKAGSIHFGRSKARSSKGTKLWGQAASSGATPARPIFGFSRSSRKRLKRYAEKRLARVFK